MEITGFVLGIFTAAVIVAVVGVFVLILQLKALWRQVQSGQREMEYLQRMLQDANDEVHRQINRVETEKGVELQALAGEVKREVMRLDASLDSRLDKLYERVLREVKEVKL